MTRAHASQNGDGYTCEARECSKPTAIFLCLSCVHRARVIDEAAAANPFEISTVVYFCGPSGSKKHIGMLVTTAPVVRISSTMHGICHNEPCSSNFAEK